MSYTSDFGLTPEEKTLQRIKELESRVDQVENTEVPRESTVRTGWVSLGKTATYLDSVSISYPATEEPDGTGGVNYIVDVSTGMKLRFKQSAGTNKYFYVVGVSLDDSSGTVTLGLTGGSDYELLDETITDVYYSYVDTPTGFPHWFNWSPTLGGFSSDPTNASYRFQIDGNKCTISVYQGIAGTSDATDFTMTVPVVSGYYAQNALALYTDNGTEYEGEGYVQIGTNESRVVLGTSGGASGWTSSGNKSASFQIGYEIKSSTTVPTIFYAEISLQGQSELTCIVPVTQEAEVDMRGYSALTAVGAVAHSGQTISGTVVLDGESSLTVSASVLTSGTVYYVDATGGSDGNGGESEGDAWQTLTKVNGETFSAGDTIKFKRGETWTGTLVPPSSGNSSNYITFEDYSTGDLPIIQGGATGEALNIAASQQYLEFNNIHFKGGSDTSQPVVDVKRPYIDFNDCTISGGLYIGFVIYSTTGIDTHHINVRNCHSYGHTKHGFYCSSSDGTQGPHDVLFENCTANNNGTTVYTDHGFYVAFGTTLDGCVAYDNFSAGIKVNSNLKPGSPYAPVVKNCISYDNVNGLYIGHYDCLFFNNIVYNNTSYNIKFDSEGDNNSFIHNTIVNSTHTNFEAIDISATTETGNFFRNNLFIQDSTISPSTVWFIDGSVSDFLTNNSCDSNLYYRSGGGETDVIISSTVDGDRDFAQFQVAGGETNGGILSSLPDIADRYTDFRPITDGNIDTFECYYWSTVTSQDINSVFRGSGANPGAYEGTVSLTTEVNIQGQSSLTVSASVSSGAVYYVDATGGSDSDDGLTEGTAWQTITKVNNATFSPGDIIKFKRGETWTGTTLVPPSSGVDGNPIIFESYGTGNIPVIDANNTQARGLSIDYDSGTDEHYLEFNDIHFTKATSQAAYVMSSYIDFNRCHFSLSGGGLVIYGNNDSGLNIHHINVIECESYNNDGQGYLCNPYPNGQYGPHDVLFQECIAHDNGTVDYADHGFYVSFGTTVDSCTAYNNHYAGFKTNCELYHDSPYSPVVKNCISYDNECGFYVGNIDSLIYNNIVYSNTSNNFVLDGDADGSEIYFNTIVNSDASPAIDQSASATNVTYKNNLLIQDSAVQSGTLFAISESLSSFLTNNTLDYNVYYRAGTGGSETVIYSSVDSSVSFTQLQTAGGETNGEILTSLPDFVDRYTDLRPVESGNIATFEGTPITGITTDINGVTRDSTPLAGAYEGVVASAASVSFEGESSLTVAGYIQGEEPDIPQTGLVAWYEADEITGLSDGENVGTWVDTGSNNYDLTDYNSQYPVYETNVKNGLPVVRFTAANLDTLQNSDAGFENAYRDVGYGAFFIVEKTNNTSTQEDTFIFQTPNSTGRFGMENNGDDIAGTFSVFSRVSDSQPNSDKLFTSAGVNDGNWHIVSALCYWAEGKAWVRVDGEQVAEDLNYCTPSNTPNTQGNRTYVGSSGGWSWMDGDIGELILYNTEISATTALQIEQYLADKWGITLATPEPTTHNGAVHFQGQSSLTAHASGSTQNAEVALAGQSALTVSATSAGDYVIDIDHETGDTSQWDESNGGAYVGVSASAGLNSTNYGLYAETDTNSSQYMRIRPTRNTTGIVRCRFYIDPNDVSQPQGNVYIAGFRDETNNNNQICYVRSYSDGSGNLYISLQVYHDSGTIAIDGLLPTGQESYVEFEITSGAGTGTAELWINGSSVDSATGIDNDSQFVGWDYFYMGVFSVVSGTTGTYYFDEILVNDDGSTIGA